MQNRFSCKKRIYRCIILLCCILLCSALASVCYADENPIFIFDYQGSHIETYSNYSIVDGKLSETHRYFVQSGNLVVIDQNLKPTARDIFIYFEGGKSYIAVLTRDGKMVSLGTEDLITKLEKFSNRNIAAITNNINTSSKTLYFTYKDGSTAAYDCVTGKLLSGTPSSEKKSISEYFSGYMTDLVERSTQGFADTSGAMAESVVRTLEESGASLETLMDAGLVEGIESAYQESDETWNGEVYDISEELGKLINSVPVTPKEKKENPEYEVFNDEMSEEELSGEILSFIKDETTRELLKKATALLSKNQLVQLRDLFAGVASGDVSSEEAKGKISFIAPSESSQTDGSEKGAKENTLEEYKRSIEDIKTAIFAIEKKREEGQYIKSSLDEKYLAVYNASEKRYDIYNQETLMKKPDNLVSEASKLKDPGSAEALNQLLAGKKGDTAQGGIRIFVVISAAIIVMAAILLTIAARNIRNKKNSYE